MASRAALHWASAHGVGTLGALGRTFARTKALARALGRDGAGRDRVEPDPVSRPLGSQRHGHGVDRGLAHRRGHHIRAAIVDPRYDDRDDVASVPAGDPAAADSMGHIECSVHHDIGDGVESAGAEIFGAGNEISGRIVDEVRERSRCKDVGHHRIDRGRVANIDAIGRDLAAVFADEFGRGRVAHRFSPTANENLRAERKEFLRHAFAQASAAAGHQNAPAAQ
jgi:hypothetical protein